MRRIEPLRSKNSMKLITAVLCLALFVILSACARQSVSPPPEEQAATGMPAESPQPNEHRIISTTVAITEMMDALELDLVGIPASEKALPERYEGVTEVGFVKTPDLEMIRALRPTEVLSVSTLEYDLRPVFEEAGIQASFLNLDSLGNMLDTMTALGKAYDREAQAERVVSAIQGKVDEIGRRIEGKERPTVLILMGIPGSYLVATEHSYIGDLVKISGGVNVVSGETVEYVASNTEYLQQANPDVILRAAHGMPKEVVEMFDKEFRTNDIWKHFSAVQNNRVYDLEESLFGTTGNLASVQALEELMEMLYPE